MKITAEPRSDQWNADDFLAGPRTFTIAAIHPGKAEQKYDIELVEGEGRVWRPPTTVLRLLIACWGDDGKQWVGRKVTLYRDEKVSFGKDQVGGIRVSHLSHIEGTRTVTLSVSRGKRGKFTVEPLPTAPAVTPDQVASSNSVDELRAMWPAASPDVQELIKAKVAELQAREVEPDGAA